MDAFVCPIIRGLEICSSELLISAKVGKEKNEDNPVIVAAALKQLITLRLFRL